MLYRWDDSQAPVLVGGAARSVTDILKACLVTGYGTKAPAGWTVAFEDTGLNAVVFRQGGGQQRVYRVVDPGGTTRVRGAENATGISTLVDPFPTVAQVGGDGLSLRRPTSGSGHWWIVVADRRTAYWFERQATQSAWSAAMLGDIASDLTGPDLYAAALIAGLPGTFTIQQWLGTTSFLDQTVTAHYIARGEDGTTKSVNVGAHAWIKYLSTGTFHGTQVYPHKADGKLHISPIWIHEPATKRPRGRLRGLWAFLHLPGALADQTSFTGAGMLAGKTFLALRDVVTDNQPTNTPGCWVVEISETWS